MMSHYCQSCEFKEYKENDQAWYCMRCGYRNVDPPIVFPKPEKQVDTTKENE